MGGVVRRKNQYNYRFEKHNGMSQNALSSFDQV